MSKETRQQRHREVIKVKNAQSRNLHLCKLIDLAEEQGYTLRHITDYQVRVNNVLDVYPTRLKYFDLTTKEWGTFTPELYEQRIIKIIAKHTITAQ